MVLQWFFDDYILLTFNDKCYWFLFVITASKDQLAWKEESVLYVVPLSKGNNVHQDPTKIFDQKKPYFWSEQISL